MGDLSSALFYNLYNLPLNLVQVYRASPTLISAIGEPAQELLCSDKLVVILCLFGLICHTALAEKGIIKVGPKTYDLVFKHLNRIVSSVALFGCGLLETCSFLKRKRRGSRSGGEVGRQSGLEKQRGGVKDFLANKPLCSHKLSQSEQIKRYPGVMGASAPRWSRENTNGERKTKTTTGEEKRGENVFILWGWEVGERWAV